MTIPRFDRALRLAAVAAFVAVGAIGCARSMQLGPAGDVLPNQTPASAAIPRTPATTPPSNDTVGYWQQRADYTIIASLDDVRGVVSAQGTLRYTNNSPDTLRDLWVHQHLNAFRPGSRWSATDAREGRQRFQSMREPDFGYERFTQPPAVNGQALVVSYPLAPDSTVVHLALRAPLPPGASLSVELAWEARPSTLPRRQGRRDRSVDLAQWYPKVAVYDRDGWKPNALVPAGEFYGEFGTFDVTMIVADDQVIGATGVPVSGDPGWARVAAPGHAPLLRAHAYADVPEGPMIKLSAGQRAVRFYARDVHHYAWSASPGFVYEGGQYVRKVAAGRYAFPVWDTVAIHVLYRGDADTYCVGAASGADAAARERSRAACVASSRTQWEGGKALQFGLIAQRWLEGLFGAYPYPQLTILKRLDGGGTEFPMMMQNGSASQGLTTHEGGHIYAYGILANNEWQSGWMDEGLTSYQTAWQSNLVRPLISDVVESLKPADPSAITVPEVAEWVRGLREATDTRNAAVRNNRAEPIGTRADLFRDFSTYNSMVYGRAAAMFEALHDALGHRVFQNFLRDYYERWAFKHVDRWALQSSAERASGQSLGWFFDQWVDRVGVVDYEARVTAIRETASGWRTEVTLTRRGEYRHPMPVGVRTSDGWIVMRGDPLQDTMVLVMETTRRPELVWLDPFGATDVVTPGRVPLN